MLIQHGIAHRCPPTRIHTCAHKQWVCGSVATGGLTWPEMDCELPDADDVGIQPLDELELPADDLGAIGSNPATAQPCRGKKRQKALLSKNVILLFFRSERQWCQDCQHPVRHATRMLQTNVLHRPMEVSLCDEVELPDDDVKLVEKDQTRIPRHERWQMQCETWKCYTTRIGYYVVAFVQLPRMVVCESYAQDKFKKRQKLAIPLNAATTRAPFSVTDLRRLYNDSDCATDDFMELFSPPRLVPLFLAENKITSISADLLTGWNLADSKIQGFLFTLLKKRAPRVIMLSPPCTVFSNLSAPQQSEKRSSCVGNEMEQWVQIA